MTVQGRIAAEARLSLDSRELYFIPRRAVGLGASMARSGFSWMRL